MGNALKSAFLAALIWLAAFPGAALAQAPAPPADQARSLLGAGKVDEAIAVLRAGVASDPAAAPLHNMLGAILNREGRYREALVHADRAARIAPDNMRYRYNRGIVLSEHGRFNEALADFNLAIAATPNDAPMYLERGAALLALGQPAKARTDWATARRLDPKLIWVDWYEGLHDLLDGRHAAAIAALAKVAEAQPDFAAAQSWLVAANLLSGGNYRPAIVSDPWVKTILDFHAGRIDANKLLEIARADRATGDRRREGEAWLHRALRLRGGRPAQARAALRKATSVDAPRHVWKLLAERLLRSPRRL